MVIVQSVNYSVLVLVNVSFVRYANLVPNKGLVYLCYSG